MSSYFLTWVSGWVAALTLTVYVRNRFEPSADPEIAAFGRQIVLMGLLGTVVMAGAAITITVAGP